MGDAIHTAAVHTAAVQAVAVQTAAGQTAKVGVAIDPGWAWAAYRPSAAAPWNLQRAGHLLRRAGLGATWSELQQAVATGPEATVERLLTLEGDSKSSDDAASFYAQARHMAASLRVAGDMHDLAAWWLHTMMRTPHPLVERMTLFWHGHFATSAAKVTDARLMYQQNELLRRHALGKFGPLMREMSKDPAMLVWLDSTTNRKSRPNENFAREVMELFCLGIGQYTEHDIKEAARTFTGWELRQGQFRFNRYQHDDGIKEVLGRRGTWNGDDCIDILLEQPATARFVVGKLFRHLVSETVEPTVELLDPLADGLRSRDYDLAWLVRTMLSSNLFYSSHALGNKIKSPIEFAIGLVRTLEGATNARALMDDLENLGQAVFYPPNVKGWDGGVTWINSSTLVARANLAWSLVGGADERYAGKLALERLQALRGLDRPADEARRLVELLLGTQPPDEVMVQLTSLAGDARGGDARRRGRLIHAIATLPEYQLV